MSPGDRIEVTGKAGKVQRGRICYVERTCAEDGRPVYRVELDGEPFGRLYCATVLRKAED